MNPPTVRHTAREMAGPSPLSLVSREARSAVRFNWVVPAGSKRVTSQYPPGASWQTAQHALLFDRLDGVCRTVRMESASPPKQGRQKPLVRSNNGYNDSTRQRRSAQRVTAPF